MEEDPDDLAAAFFAQQAAKEKAQTTLPIDDWAYVVNAALQKSKGTSSSSAENIGGDGKDTASGGDTNNGQSRSCKVSNEGKIDVEAWLVKTLPPPPPTQKINGMGNNKEGDIMGVILDSDDTHCSLGIQHISEALE